jgi:hypothetical protein
MAGSRFKNAPSAAIPQAMTADRNVTDLTLNPLVRTRQGI